MIPWVFLAKCKPGIAVCLCQLSYLGSARTSDSSKRVSIPFLSKHDKETKAAGAEAKVTLAKGRSGTYARKTFINQF